MFHKIVQIIKEETECDDPYCNVLYVENAAKRVVDEVVKQELEYMHKDQRQIIPENDGYYWLRRDAEMPCIVRLYFNHDMKKRGVGFNTSEGGGFIPLDDLSEMSYFAGPIDEPVD